VSVITLAVVIGEGVGFCANAVEAKVKVIIHSEMRDSHLLHVLVESRSIAVAFCVNVVVLIMLIGYCFGFNYPLLK
jgi:hypothetical protein